MSRRRSNNNSISNSAKSRMIPTSEKRNNKVFLRIENQIREKNRRRRSTAREESFVDRDRAIAVGAEEDLKGHILKHRGDITRTTTASGERDGEFIKTILEQAAHELKYGDPENALAYIQKGENIRPDTIECLILKGTCLMQANRLNEALKTVDHLIFHFKQVENPEVLTVKGDALYNLGKFEHALVNYYRALHYSSSKRRESIETRIIRTRLAITNCIGPLAPNLFREIRSDTMDKISKIMNAKSLTATSSSELDKTLLHDMAKDKAYLEEFVGKVGSHKLIASKKFSASVKRQALEAIDFLQNRKDFWIQHTLRTHANT